MDTFYPNKRGFRFVLVYKDKLQVLDDYIRSLSLFDEIIEIDDFNKSNNFLNSNDIYVFTQLWLPPKSQSKLLLQSPRFIFLNVENLTENLRHEQMAQYIQCGSRIADYSLSNIAIMNEYIKDNCIDYKYKPLYMPYQGHPIDFCQLYNTKKEYEYDIGVINAVIEQNDSVNSSLNYRRNLMWDKIQQQTKWKSLNIMGWDEERDDLIKKCKIIVNIHHFECFKIYQHIRCDRLTFANKLIISEKSLLDDRLDICNSVIFGHYDNIIEIIQQTLDNFNEIQNRMERIPKEPIIKQRQVLLQQTIDDIIDNMENDLKNTIEEYPTKSV